MICEVKIKNNKTEVSLSHVTFGDIIAFIRVWLSKDKEVVFSEPVEQTESGNE